VEGFQRCPLCNEPWSNAAVHLEVPYLAEPGDLTVWYCFDAGQHVQVRATLTVDPWAWMARVRELIRYRRRWS
jgi:hypothetical protein